MGSYKYIMMYFSLSALVYSLLSILVRPDILSYSSCFVVFIQNSNALFSPKVMVYLISSICGFYFFFTSLIAVHFVYRYNALKNGSQWVYFRGKFSVLWFLISPLLYVNWTMNCLLAFQPNPKSTEFLRNRILTEFGIDVDGITYIIADFYPTDEFGVVHPNWNTFISGFNFLVMTILSLSVIFVYAFKCYFETTRVQLAGRNCSLALKLLHTQLFCALLFQTLIPLVIMYIPLFILFVFPMLYIDIGFAEYVAISISVYPALDALPTLLFVRDYRNSISRCVRRKHTDDVRSIEPYYVRRASTNFSAPINSAVQASRIEFA
ncbi:unnamed protein product [Caenorhabditis sp. 36 PRJEB53466]|nr:unnamed protein product [Caenorhabditis sp. 36 PRJEB53466]